MQSSSPDSVNPLRLARYLRGVSARELAVEVGCSGGRVSQLEASSKPMTEAVAAPFAAALGVPVAFLVAGGFEVGAPVLHFRHRRNTPAPARHRAGARAVVAHLLVGELAKHFTALQGANLPSPWEVDLSGEPGDPGRLTRIERVAQELRKRWGMRDGPIPDVIRVIESQGVWVLELPSEDRHIDAYSWSMGGHAYMGLVPVRLDEARQERNPYRERFSALHELGHLVLHPDLPDQLVGTREVEAEAHRFAAAFLVPPTRWVARAPRSVKWEDYIDEAAVWGTSVSALLRRSLDLGVIDPWRYRAAMIHMSSTIGRRDEGAHLPERPHEEPARIAAHLAKLAAGRGVSLAHLAEKIGLPVEDLRALVPGLPAEVSGPAARAGRVLEFPRRGA